MTAVDWTTESRETSDLIKKTCSKCGSRKYRTEFPRAGVGWKRRAVCLTCYQAEIIFICDCGQTFERRHAYAAHARYCKTKIAQREQRWEMAVPSGQHYLGGNNE